MGEAQMEIIGSKTTFFIVPGEGVPLPGGWGAGNMTESSYRSL